MAGALRRPAERHGHPRRVLPEGHPAAERADRAEELGRHDEGRRGAEGQEHLPPVVRVRPVRLAADDELLLRERRRPVRRAAERRGRERAQRRIGHLPVQPGQARLHQPQRPRQQQGRRHQGVRRGPGGHLHQPAGPAGAPAVAGRQDGSADPAHGTARGQGRPVLGQQLLRVQQEQGPRGREGVDQVVGGQQRTAVLRRPRPAGAGAEVRGREPVLQ